MGGESKGVGEIESEMDGHKHTNPNGTETFPVFPPASCTGKTEIPHNWQSKIGKLFPIFVLASLT